MINYTVLGCFFYTPRLSGFLLSNIGTFGCLMAGGLTGWAWCVKLSGSNTPALFIVRKLNFQDF